MPNNFDQSQIEEQISDVLRELGVSKNIYSNRPRSSSADLKDFVVIKVRGVEDLRAFGYATLSISLFARDVANVKNKKKLSVMQEKVTQGMPRSYSGMLIDDVPKILGDTPDKDGYHARIIHYSIIIKTVLI